MEQKYWYLIIGIAIGWITKVPFIIKWYRDLKNTRAYEKMRDAVHVEEMRIRYNEMYPDKPINKPLKQ